MKSLEGARILQILVFSLVVSVLDLGAVTPGYAQSTDLPPTCERTCSSSSDCADFCYSSCEVSINEGVTDVKCEVSSCGESATCATDVPCDEFCSKSGNCGKTCRDKNGFTQLCQACSDGEEEAGEGNGGNGCTYRPCSAFDLSRKLIGQFQGEDGYVYDRYCGRPIREVHDCLEFCPDKIWIERRCVGTVTPWSIDCMAPGEGKNASDCVPRFMMLGSNRDPRLAINAWDGARHGTVLRLHEGCRPNNPDCTWHWENGMIVSDRDPRLAINAWDGARHGTVLRLHEGCRTNNPDCTWHWENGMIVSDRDPRLAINAWDGAQHGTVLRLHEGCRPDNPDCTWQDLM